MDLALYQPDIAPNTAAILRTAVCFGARVHIVGPAGFDLSDRAVRRAGLDYAASAAIVRHVDFLTFLNAVERVVLFTTRGTTSLPSFAFQAGDVLLFGRESAGVPESVHAACPHRVRIPMVESARSLNLAVAAGIGLAAALTGASQMEQQGLS